MISQDKGMLLDDSDEKNGSKKEPHFSPLSSFACTSSFINSIAASLSFCSSSYFDYNCVVIPSSPINSILKILLSTLNVAIFMSIRFLKREGLLC